MISRDEANEVHKQAAEFSPTILQQLQGALKEDLGQGDITTETTVPKESRLQARILAKEKGIVAGIPLVLEVYRLLDTRVQFSTTDLEGKEVEPGQTLIEISGPARPILTGERLALNLLMRLSGIATLTRKFVDLAASYNIKILDTRKTTPLWREIEKYAVRQGGGTNHRQGLYDQILIKENHIAIAGSASEALRRAREKRNRPVKIEIEVETLDQLKEILPLKPDIILLDNMSPEEVEKAGEMASTYREVEIEISGGIGLDTIEKYLLPCVDRISIGSLTHSAPAFDLSLEVMKILHEED